MLQKTKGIVLRAVKYGETSLIVTIFTEKFGVQSYMVNSVRSATKKAGPKAGMFQPPAMLELVAYHNDMKNLQRLKEFKWAVLYQHIFSEIPKNSVALFMIEMLTKCLKQPEDNSELFYFMEDALLHLDKASDKVTANFPLFFALHLAVFFGFRISDEFTRDLTYLDLEEGRFTNAQPQHLNYLQDVEAETVSDILKMMHPDELAQLSLNQETRRRILQALELYYALHMPEFGSLRTLPILREVMS